VAERRGGPGIKNLGETGSVWTDHTDARPTLLTLLGLHDDYADAISTGTASDDSTYTGMDAQLQTCASARAALASQIQGVLRAAENGKALVNRWEADRLMADADALIGDVNGLAQDSAPPSSPACG
jgi:hypothetical protein